jgi:DNA-binding transcriptional MerR regulator
MRNTHTINRTHNNARRKIIVAKDIIHKYNFSYQTVNHYTDFGLLPVLFKKGNVRFYDREVVEQRLKEINKLIEEGYSLHLIRKKLIGI